jgi:hypothetical protein
VPSAAMRRLSSFKPIHPPYPGSLHSQNAQPSTGLRVLSIAAQRGY